MNRLAKHITDLKSHYDVVVVGSGYGGSIAASRFSRAGKKVCLLEKGKEFLPGEFPDDLNSARKEMQFRKGNFDVGSDNGLYEFVVGEDISVFKGCGLGGTSLVNANVSIEADPRIFQDQEWPEEIRNDPDSLKRGIERARGMLKPNPYPEGKNGYPVLNKTEGMRKSAQAMGEEFSFLDLNISFESKTNHVGVEQKNCTNCGDCVTGCNRGAKNTTAMNYLPDARNHGADIFTEISVRYIKKLSNGWGIYFHPLGTGAGKFDAPEMFTTADNVILSGGSLGSTEILMRSREKGLGLSDQLGSRFTGNGDILAFGYNNDQPINGIGKPQAAFGDKIENVGPCITSVIDMRKNEPLEDGMTLEEGTIPGPIRSILVPTMVSFSRILGKDTDRGFKDYLKEKWRELKSIFGGPYKGAVDSTQVYLVMSNDDGNGEMRMEKDELIIHWDEVGKQEIFKKVNGKLRKATAALGGNFIKNPSWTKLLDYDLVTVHPLGGCSMGSSSTNGVVDHKGQVFSGSGNEKHTGLFVMDGAILPRPVGTNPLLTISGISERNCEKIAEEKGWNIPYDFNPDLVPNKNGSSVVPGVQFTERMTGYFTKDANVDYEKGFETGKAENSEFDFILTIQSDDVKTFVQNKSHQAKLNGVMRAKALSDSALSAINGTFNLFVDNPDEGEGKKMLYSCQLLSEEGKTYYFEGFKDVKDDKGFDVWSDTSTLFITVYDGPDADQPVVGRGKLKIELKDFMKQMTTMKALNVNSNTEGLKAIATFGNFFSKNIFEQYFKP